MFQAYLKGNDSICTRDAHNVDDVGTLSHQNSTNIVPIATTEADDPDFAIKTA